MYSTSTQLKYWTFSSEEELSQLRHDANQNFVTAYGTEMTENEKADHFLTPSEERFLIRQYEHVIREFCNKFQPIFPKCILGASLALFKRFWVNNSVMDFHPKDIMLTVVYLACKVEEFYVPIGQFVSNLKGCREVFADTILSFELLFMSKLDFQLTVHSPFRAFEGFIIDIKTRCRGVEEVEKLRRRAVEYIDYCLMTDIPLMFSPCQIALAGILHSASKDGINLERYVTMVLNNGSSSEDITRCIQQIKSLKRIAAVEDPIPRDVISAIQRKLERCRNPVNNPDSERFHGRVRETFDDNEDSVQADATVPE